MQSLIYIFPYLKKYRALIAGNVISNILMVLFSIISIPAIIPFLNILLNQQPLVEEPPEESLSTHNIAEHVNYYFSQIIESEGRQTALAYALLAIVILYFLKNLFRYLSQFFLAPIRNGIVRDLRQGLYEKTLALPMAYYSEERKGDLLSRMSVDVQEVEQSILSGLVNIVREPLMILGALAFMVYISFSLTLFVLVLLFFVGGVIGRVGKMLKRQSHKVQQQLGLLMSMMEEAISGLRIIKAFNAESFQSRHFFKENNIYNNLLVRLLWRRDLSSPLTEFLGVMTVALLIWYGYGEVQSGSLTVATFFAMLYAFFSMIEPAKKLSAAWYNLQKGAAAMERIKAVQQADIRITEKEGALSVKYFKKAIEFKDVSVVYNKNEPAALSGINLRVEQGMVVALAGPSGAGKTTLVDLLPRFLDPTQGEVLLDGINVKEYKLRDLRSLLGLVSQEPVLFNDTIFNNIAFGLPGVSQQDVERAARVAHAHEFIMETENGYQTNIGDRGMKLSGGQRQRLTIARAILANPPILILDEATSALDSESEKLVQDALAKLMKNRTSIVIAHRLSTIRHADVIVVMKDGRIVETGTHEELIGQKGEYGKLVALQSF
ncbi:MAG TPA: ATP-binding cassette domain-containing protein [Bacteroidetes bacterium]|nr:ATP-binding cassette domain-containing protein [Bacteroidota bacterium]